LNSNDENLTQVLSKAVSASLIRFSVIAFVVFVCVWAFWPFLPIMLWALVLAIALYPVCQFLRARYGWSPARASTLIALFGVLLLGAPTAMVGNSFASKIFGVYDSYEAGTLTVPEPAAEVKDWPVLGDDLHSA
jgi:predicted PurR-regulated permease PerM